MSCRASHVECSPKPSTLNPNPNPKLEGVVSPRVTGVRLALHHDLFEGSTSQHLPSAVCSTCCHRLGRPRVRFASTCTCPPGGFVMRRNKSPLMFVDVVAIGFSSNMFQSCDVSHSAWHWCHADSCCFASSNLCCGKVFSIQSEVWGPMNPNIGSSDMCCPPA